MIIEIAGVGTWSKCGLNYAMHYHEHMYHLMLVNSQVCGCRNLHGLPVHIRVVSGDLSQSARTWSLVLHVSNG